MAVPCYLSTEWEGLGQATLRFRPNNVVGVLPGPDKGQVVGKEVSCLPGEASWSWSPFSWKYRIPLFSGPKESQPLVDTHNIECYQSAVYIMEYGKRETKVPKQCAENKEFAEDMEESPATNNEQEIPVKHQNGVQDNPHATIEGDKDDLRPPGIVPEVWNAWLDYWEAWKEVLIPLSWVHKYRSHCTPEYITWHDSYLEDYPEVLLLITDALGNSELNEDIVKENSGNEAAPCDFKADVTEFNGSGGQKTVCGESRMDEESENTSPVSTGVNGEAKDTEEEQMKRKVLDDLYTKHTKRRYLVHLCNFLHLSGIECNQDIEIFFERKAGIKFATHTVGEACNEETKASEKSSHKLEQEPCQTEGYEAMNSGENYDNEKTRNMSLQSVTVKEQESQEQMAKNKKVTEENMIGTFLKGVHPNNLPDLQDMSDSGRESCRKDLSSEDKRAEPHIFETTEEVNVTSGEEKNILEVSTDAPDANLSGQKLKTSKKRKRNKDPARSQGISWALRYVQTQTNSQNEEEAHKSREMTSLPHETATAAGQGPLEDPRCASVSVVGDSGTSETILGSIEKNTFNSYEEDFSMMNKRLRRISTSDGNEGQQGFMSWFPEGMRKSEKKCMRKRERESLLESLQKSPTCLVKLQTTCCAVLNKAAVNLKKIFLPSAALHFLNIAFPGAAEVEYQLPHGVFGVQGLQESNASFNVDGKGIRRHQRRLHKWLEGQDPHSLSSSCNVELTGMVMFKVHPHPDSRRPHRVYQEVVKEQDNTEDSCHHLTLHILHPLNNQNEPEDREGNNVHSEVDKSMMKITFDEDGNFSFNKSDSDAQQTQDCEKDETEAWKRFIHGFQRLSYWDDNNSLPSDLPQSIRKYWAQRYRLFLKYDEGIILDSESWYSVTPEILAAHQARRCRCEVVVDAMCGAGGNAIQLAKICDRVIAIDVDPRKVELARHNAEVYGVADRIEFRVGDFFKLAPYIKADVVYLSPPWGGVEYLKENVYNVYSLGGTMNCARLLKAARGITPNIVLYLPRNSDLCQVIALAGVNGVVDIETNFMGSKKKAITAYFGSLLATKYV